MLAVIELWWNQFIVRVWDIIDVKKQDINVDSILNVKALLISDEDASSIQIWSPILENSNISLKVLDQFKWEKVRVFKKKSKKRFVRNRGFRVSLTKLEVLSIA